MKTTTVAVIALTAASVCAQPIVMLRKYNAGIPRAVADLEARKWHTNRGKVGDDDYLLARDSKQGHPQPHPRPHSQPHPPHHPPHRGSAGRNIGWPPVRKFDITKFDWGGFAKNAEDFVKQVLWKRIDKDELYARGFIDGEDLVTREVHLLAHDDEQDDEDGHRHRPHCLPHRGSGHGEAHQQGGKRRPTRPTGNLDDLD